MLTESENALLTNVGPGTPMGDLLRRYWQPVAAATEMEDRWTKRVRIMGEDLVLFRDRSGRLGLIGEQCPHRRASLAYGIPSADGIRCPYHGWMFDGTGRCLEQPNEPEGSNFKDKVSLAGYPVQELAGLIFAYMGPLPAPIMTKLDGYVASPAIRLIGKAEIPCNWLQIQENSVDPVHSEWLHGHFAEFLAEQRGVKYAFSGHHLKIAFDEKPYGIVKRRLKVGQSEDCSDWTVGHPLVFPNILALGQADRAWMTYAFEIRVPIDDTHTANWWFTAFKPAAGSDVPASLMAKAFYFDVPIDTNEYDTVAFQDIVAWRTQGDIADRSLEHLGSTDRGVTMFRRMLHRELDKVAAGEDPMLVNRDPASDVPLDLPIEHDKAHYSEGFASLVPRRVWKYAGISDELIAAHNAAQRTLAAT
jgi:5,5'-dehydrodivanillate O-demethylase